VACTGDAENQSEIPPATAETTPNSDTSAPQSANALCIAHGVATSQCFICDAALREPGRLWCREHTRYEDRCFECHPELRDKNRLYCEEHGLYEDECFLCHPELKLEESSADPAEAGISVASSTSDALFCGEHNVPEAECGICQPTLADNLKPGQGLKIRLPSMASEAKANIVAQHPQPGPARSTVHAVGELRFNLNRLVHITPLTDGVVRRVHVNLGQEVKKGQVLAELRSPQIAESKAELLKTVAEETVSSEALSRARGLHDQNVLSAQDLYDAEARHTTARAGLRAAEQMLLDLGFDRQTLERIVSEQEAKSVLSLVAPFAGTVIERDAVVGDVVTMGDQMFSIADLSTLWLSLAVSQREVVNLRVGQRVEIRSQALDREIAGEITWISSRLNETTRMAEVLAEVANPAATLRAGMFVDASIIVGESSASLLVPRDTIHRFGGNPFVFVRLAGDLYELRRVEIRTASENLTAVTAGLTEHDLIAVEQSYLLKSEFQKSRLGAGCVE
ncbi:MAG: efflux RND transporter periplasmic adaptor subunit, partial [Candidatus Krumholzibacteria bacterium]|nr:efflux RND transporter periplasmic adaptor subunit [Candidatus Krumholzibacteria bacterium]